MSLYFLLKIKEATTKKRKSEKAKKRKAQGQRIILCFGFCVSKSEKSRKSLLAFTRSNLSFLYKFHVQKKITILVDETGCVREKDASPSKTVELTYIFLHTRNFS